jgi:thymidine phosphorylase
MLQAALDTGAAAERFQQMVTALGGPKRFLDDPWKHMERAEVRLPVFADHSGAVTRIDTRAVGMVVVALGGGRSRPQDPVDHAVGLTHLADIGTQVGGDEPLGVVHARTDLQAVEAAALLRAAYRVGGKPAAVTPPVLDRITAS